MEDENVASTPNLNETRLKPHRVCFMRVIEIDGQKFGSVSQKSDC